MKDVTGKEIKIGDLLEIIHTTDVNYAIYSFIKPEEIIMVLSIENKQYFLPRKANYWDIEFLQKNKKQKLSFKPNEPEKIFRIVNDK